MALIVSDVFRPDHAGVCIVKFQSNGVVDDMNINMNFGMDGWTKVWTSGWGRRVSLFRNTELEGLARYVLCKDMSE